MNSLNFIGFGAKKFSELAGKSFVRKNGQLVEENPKPNQTLRELELHPGADHFNRGNQEARN